MKLSEVFHAQHQRLMKGQWVRYSPKSEDQVCLVAYKENGQVHWMDLDLCNADYVREIHDILFQAIAEVDPDNANDKSIKILGPWSWNDMYAKPGMALEVLELAERIAKEREHDGS